MLQKALNSKCFGSIVFARHSRNRARMDKLEIKGEEERRRGRGETRRFHDGGAGERSGRVVVKFHWCQINFRVIWKFN